MICAACQFDTEREVGCHCGRCFCPQCFSEHACEQQDEGGMPLREYQRKAHDSVCAEFSGGAKSTLVVMPTGTGKTILFAELIRKWIGFSS